MRGAAQPWVGVAAPGVKPVIDLAALRQRRRWRHKDQNLGKKGFKGRKHLQVDGLKLEKR